MLIMSMPIKFSKLPSIPDLTLLWFNIWIIQVAKRLQSLPQWGEDLLLRPFVILGHISHICISYRTSIGDTFLLQGFLSAKWRAVQGCSTLSKSPLQDSLSTPSPYIHLPTLLSLSYPPHGQSCFLWAIKTVPLPQRGQPILKRLPCRGGGTRNTSCPAETPWGCGGYSPRFPGFW